MMIEKDVFQFFFEPKLFIVSTFNTMNFVFENTIKKSLPADLEAVFGYPEDMKQWADEYLEKMDKWIKKLTPEYLQGLDFHVIQANEDKLTQYLDYRSYIGHESDNMDDKTLCPLIKKEMENSINFCKEIYKLNF